MVERERAALFGPLARHSDGGPLGEIGRSHLDGVQLRLRYALAIQRHSIACPVLAPGGPGGSTKRARRQGFGCALVDDGGCDVLVWAGGYCGSGSIICWLCRRQLPAGAFIGGQGSIEKWILGD